MIDRTIYPTERHNISLTMSEFETVKERVVCAWEESNKNTNRSGLPFQVEYFLHNPFRKLKIPWSDYVECSMEAVLHDKLPIDPDLGVDLSKPEGFE